MQVSDSDSAVSIRGKGWEERGGAVTAMRRVVLSIVQSSPLPHQDMAGIRRSYIIYRTKLGPASRS